MIYLFILLFLHREKYPSGTDINTDVRLHFYYNYYYIDAFYLGFRYAILDLNICQP
jgi:hypothetical protein